MPSHRLSGGELYSFTNFRRNKFLLCFDLRTQVIIILFFLGLSVAQRKFAHSLRDFKFEFIGDAVTDDERCIGN